MSEPYLIAHLVRGEPAFDIGIKCDDMGTESDPGPWWIIPTSGHRAYPYWHLSLNECYTPMVCDYECVTSSIPAPPPNHPDHYTSHAAPHTGLITNLAERLGFVPKPTTITRR